MINSRSILKLNNLVEIKWSNGRVKRELQGIWWENVLPFKLSDWPKVWNSWSSQLIGMTFLKLGIVSLCLLVDPPFFLCAILLILICIILRYYLSTLNLFVVVVGPTYYNISTPKLLKYLLLQIILVITLKLEWFHS